MVAADEDGNIVALITSLTSDFGSLVFVPDGDFLNNAMRNFDPRPDRANCIAPGKMPIFAVPAIVAEREGIGVFGACGSGGYRVTSGVSTHSSTTSTSGCAFSRPSIARASTARGKRHLSTAAFCSQCSSSSLSSATSSSPQDDAVPD